jgi:uncharacterized peroxidase-related enzyme
MAIGPFGLKGVQSLALVNPFSAELASAEVREIYTALESRFGRVPDFYASMAHHPEALQTFLPFYQAILGKGALALCDKELAYLQTSLLNRCAYCIKAHTAAARRAGIAVEKIQALAAYQQSNLFDEKEKVILQFAESLTLQASVNREGLQEELKKYFSDNEVVELTLTICMANFTNRFNNALQLTPDIG